MNEFVINYRLETGFDFDFDGLGFWFDKPRIVIKAGGKVRGTDAPDCVHRFAEILTENFEAVLAYPGPLGEEFRTLKALLMLNEVLNWGRFFIPIKPERMESFPTARFENVPPAVEQFPQLFIYRGEISGIAYEGGIRFPIASATEAARQTKKRGPRKRASPAAAAAALKRDKRHSDPVFVVVSDSRQGRDHMRIDISSLLALVPSG